jgi:hypothetical protein
LLLITASPICQSLAAILLIKASPAIALKKASYKKQLKGGGNKKGPKARENKGLKMRLALTQKLVASDLVSTRYVNAICATREYGG